MQALIQADVTKSNPEISLVTFEFAKHLFSFGLRLNSVFHTAKEKSD